MRPTVKTDACFRPGFKLCILVQIDGLFGRENIRFHQIYNGRQGKERKKSIPRAYGGVRCDTGRPSKSVLIFWPPQAYVAPTKIMCAAPRNWYVRFNACRSFEVYGYGITAARYDSRIFVTEADYNDISGKTIRSAAAEGVLNTTAARRSAL